MKESIKVYYNQLPAPQRTLFDRLFMKDGMVVDYTTLEGPDRELTIK